MFEYLSPPFLQEAIELVVESRPGFLRPQLVAYVLAAVYLLILVRVLRYGLLRLDLQVAQHARAQGREPPLLAHALGRTAVILFWAVVAFVALVGLAEVWLTLSRKTGLSELSWSEGMDRCALALSRFFW